MDWHYGHLPKGVQEVGYPAGTVKDASTCEKVKTCTRAKCCLGADTKCENNNCHNRGVEIWPKGTIGYCRPVPGK